jgi:hypothetical protein
MSSREASRARVPWLTGLALLLLVAVAVESLALGRRFSGFDFYQFWAVGQLLEGLEDANVYADPQRAELSRRAHERSRAPGTPPRQRRAGQQRRSLEIFSTPFLYTSFALASSGDYEVDWRRYQILASAAGMAAVVLLGRVLGWGWASALLAAALLSRLGDPFLSDLKTGNVNRLQLLGVALFAWVASRAPSAALQALAGLVLGLWIAFKPNLLLVPVLVGLGWALEGRWRALGALASGVAAGTLIAVAASSVAFGSPGSWIHWAEATVFLTQGAGRPTLLGLEKGNLSLAQWIFEETGWEASALLSVLLVGASVWALWVARRQGRAPHGSDPAGSRLVLLAGLGCAIPLLAWPLAWVHYFVLVTPLALYLLRPRPGQGGPGVWTQRGLALLALATLCASHVYGSLGWEPEAVMRLGQRLFTGACLTLVALSLWALARGEAVEAR